MSKYKVGDKVRVALHWNIAKYCKLKGCSVKGTKSIGQVIGQESNTNYYYPCHYIVKLAKDCIFHFSESLDLGNNYIIRKNQND